MRSHVTRHRLIGCLALLLLTVVPAWAGLLRSRWQPNWSLDGVPTRLIEVPVAAPVGITTCPGVRPGAIVESDTGQCTFNFVYAGSDGATYIGTAGHCILGESPIGGDVGESSWEPGAGPEARDGSGTRIGEFAYAILQGPKDFAVIRADPGITVDPQVCHFGGPTGVNSDQGSGLVVLHHYGNGVAIGSVLPARTGAALGMPDPDHVFATAAALPGDSGSSVISDDGRAVGVLVTVGVHTGAIGAGGVDAGVVGITRLGPQLARASAVLEIALTLVTAPTL